MPDDVERLLTIGELAAMLGVPVDTLYGWRHRGEVNRPGIGGGRVLSGSGCCWEWF